MNESLILLALTAVTLAAYFLSLVYVIGIVWRVELELDVSYKFFSLTVLLLLATEIIEILPSTQDGLLWVSLLHVMKLLSAVTLFLGMFFMRDLIRKMDGEKPPKQDK